MNVHNALIAKQRLMLAISYIVVVRNVLVQMQSPFVRFVELASGCCRGGYMNEDLVHCLRNRSYSLPLPLGQKITATMHQRAVTGFDFDTIVCSIQQI